MNRRRPKQSVFLLLIALFMIVVLSIYLLGFGLYQWGYNMTTDEITQSMRARTDFFINTLESEIQRIRQVHQECLHDDNLYYYVNASGIMRKYEDVTNLLNIQKRLELVYDSSAYISDVKLWMPRLPHMISASKGVEPGEDAWRDLIDAPVIASEAGLSIYEGRLYLVSTYPIGRGVHDTTPLYVLCIELSGEKIVEDMMSFNTYPEAGTQLRIPERDLRMLAGRDIGIATDVPSVPEKAIQKGYKAENGEKYLLINVVSKYLGMDMYTYVSESVIYGSLERYRIMFIVFTIVACGMVALYFRLAKRLVNEPLKKLVNALSWVEKGDLHVQIAHDKDDEFSYVYTAFNQMVASLENMMEINYRQRMLMREAELKQLQAQINPHFLHNSFFILYRMVKDEDYENLSDFLIYLSDYYRYITRDGSKEVSLGEEDKHARQYVQIQLVRFKKRISAEFALLPSEYLGIRVPRLILQPLLENVFNHGLKDVASDGRLRVWHEAQDGRLYIHVEDNGAGMDAQQLAALQIKLDGPVDEGEEVTGIINIHQRLRIMFGQEYGLQIRAPKTGGARFSLVIPANGNSGGQAWKGE